MLGALSFSLLFHLAVAWGLAWGLSSASADTDTVDTLAQLDLSSVDLSFSEQEAEAAPPQVSPPVAPPAEAPPPSPPEVDPVEPPPMENLPDDPTAVLQLAKRPDDFQTALTPPEVSAPPDPPVPLPVAPRVAVPAPQQDRVDSPPNVNARQLEKALYKIYPRLSRERGEEGDVVLEVSVDAKGVVLSVTVCEPSVPAQRLREAAMKAMRAVRFAPARSGGKPVPAKVKLTLNFRLTS